jgi:hypothetical protein
MMKPLRLGQHIIDPLILAPMAGVTDRPFSSNLPSKVQVTLSVKWSPLIPVYGKAINLVLE